MRCFVGPSECWLFARCSGLGNRSPNRSWTDTGWYRRSMFAYSRDCSDSVVVVVVTVSRRLLSSVPSFTLYDNPLYCDCHLHWIATVRHCSDVDSASCDRRRLLAGSQTRCSGPAALAGLALPDVFAVDGGDDAGTCGPVVTALFDPLMFLPTGSTLRLDCRIAGLTSPSSATWITPRRRRPLDVERSLTGTVLSIRHLESRDAGTYRCLAVDPDTNGSSSTSTALRVYNVDARVLPVFAETTSVMITWSGTDSTLAAADYVVAYRLLPVRNHSDLAARETDRGTIHLRPYLRKYTINDLRPGQTYEFCIATEVSASDWMQLHCVRVTTQREVRSYTTVNSGRVVLVALVAGLFLLLVLRCACVRRRRVCRTPNLTTAGTRRSSLSGLPLKQFVSQRTDDDEHVESSRTSLIRAVN